MKQFYKTFYLVLIIFLVNIVSAQVFFGFENTENVKFQEGVPPTIISGEPTAGKNTEHFNIDGGSVKLTKDYNGRIKIIGRGGKIKTSDENQHEFKSGTIEIKNGKIYSIKEANAVKFQIPINKYWGYEISGDKISYNLDNKLITADKKIKYIRYDDSVSGSDFFELISDDEIKLELRDHTLIAIDNDPLKVYDQDGYVGKFKGDFGFLHFGNRNMNIAPSKDSPFAEFELEKGIQGSITKNILLDYAKFDKYSKTYEDEIFGTISGISINGNLHIHAQDNNIIDLKINNRAFDYINQDLIEDESRVILQFEDNKGDREILFSKNEPLIRGDFSNFKGLIGTRFEKNGNSWSWEMKDGNPTPKIYQKNLLYLYTKDFPPEFAAKAARFSFMNPITGEFSLKESSIETILRRQIARPIISYNEKIKEDIIFIEGLKPHEYNLYPKKFHDVESFINSLTANSENGKPYDKLIIHSHGDPESFKIFEDTNPSRITSQDLRNIPQETLSKIKNGFSSTATCTALSCLIMLNTQNIETRILYKSRDSILKDDDSIFGVELSKILGIPVVGSVPEISELQIGESMRFYSEKMIVVTPEKGKIKISDEPPNFKSVLILIKSLYLLVKNGI